METNEEQKLEGEKHDVTPISYPEIMMICGEQALEIRMLQEFKKNALRRIKQQEDKILKYESKYPDLKEE